VVVRGDLRTRQGNSSLKLLARAAGHGRSLGTEAGRKRRGTAGRTTREIGGAKATGCWSTVGITGCGRLLIRNDGGGGGERWGTNPTGMRDCYRLKTPLRTRGTGILSQEVDQTVRGLRESWKKKKNMSNSICKGTSLRGFGGVIRV